jgi:hypothetical protein
MTRFYGVLGAIAVVSLLCAAAGCGETVIDSKKTEELLEAELPKSLGKKVSSVDCPSGVEVKTGATFTCTVTVQGGERQTATLKIRDDKADVAVVGLSGAESGSKQPNE